MKKNSWWCLMLWMGIQGVCIVQASAEELKQSDFFGSGFLTLAAGKMLGGAEGNVGDYQCPCFVSDYAQAGIFDGRSAWQWRPDSKLGLQGGVRKGDFTLTGQALARGANGRIDLSWLYGTFKLNELVSVQAGRKRLPLFYYSDAQDVGIALPWTHLPTWLYGWQAVNYNGVNVVYNDQWADWSVTANVLAGREHRKNSGYWKVYGNGRDSVTDVKWDNIVGGDVTVVRDWFEARIVYLQSKTQDINVNRIWNYDTLSYDPPTGAGPVAKQKMYGLAFKAEYKSWLIFNEFVHIDHPGLSYRDFAQIVSVGYRFDKWLPMLTWGHYKGVVVTEGVLPGAPASLPNSQQTYTYSLRYDLTPSSAIKLQYDDTSDHSDADFVPKYGSSQLLTVAYDLMF